MPELPQKKVGIVACSGEELPEGTVARLAALRVLEQLRPGQTATICLPLFLAGGEADRAFAKYYPTIAVDGCKKRCAYRGTEMYSNRPAASLVVSDLVAAQGLPSPQGRRRLDAAGRQAVEAAASQIAAHVDRLLGQSWSRREGKFTLLEMQEAPPEETVATCACGSGIPVQKVLVDGQEMTLVALPVIFENFHDAGKSPSESVLAEMMEMVKIYNAIHPAGEAAVRRAVDREYRAYWEKHEAGRA